MRSKKLKRILGTSWESLFNIVIQGEWEKGNKIEKIVLSERAAFPLIPRKHIRDKRSMDVYESDFGAHEIKIDKRFKGDQMFFYGKSSE